MTQRMSYSAVAPAVYRTMLHMQEYLVKQSGLDARLLDLVYLRVSQVNGCAYCVDMHWKDLRTAGESEQRLYMLNVWREWAGYNDRERAALAFAEAVTTIHGGEVPDAVYQQARGQFTEMELANLALAVVSINGWNRLNIAFRMEAGNYQAPVRSKAPAGS